MGSHFYRPGFVGRRLKNATVMYYGPTPPENDLWQWPDVMRRAIETMEAGDD